MRRERPHSNKKSNTATVSRRPSGDRDRRDSHHHNKSHANNSNNKGSAKPTGEKVNVAGLKKMKVSEAKTKVCPFISLGRINIRPDTLEYESTNGFSNCICGDCMAWVYTKTKTCGIKKEWLAQPEDYKGLPENEKEGYCSRIGDG